MIVRKISDLPDEVRVRVLERAAETDSNVVVRKPTSNGLWILAVTLCILWFAALFAFAFDFRWTTAKTIVLGSLTLIAAFNFVRVAGRLAAARRPVLPFSILITPGYVAQVAGGSLTVWGIDELITVDGRKLPNGVTRITLGFKERPVVFAMADSDRADEIVDRVEESRKRFIEASARGDVGYVGSFDDFPHSGAESGDVAPVGAWGLITQSLGIAGLTAAMMAAAWFANELWDDRLSWDEARLADRAGAYRKYVEMHPGGRWLGPAGVRRDELYVEAETNYRNAISKDSDPRAAEALLKMLRYARSSGRYAVRLLFERKNEIPADIVGRLKKANGYDRILEIGDSFAESKMAEREYAVVGAIGLAFRQLIPEDILLVGRDCTECTEFVVRYTVGADDLIYFDLRQEKVAEDDRTYYPGVFFNWHCEVRIPGDADPYSFGLRSEPADEITYDTIAAANVLPDEFANVLKAELPVVYESMAASAFDDFRANLVHKFGVGTDPRELKRRKVESKNSGR